MADYTEADLQTIRAARLRGIRTIQWADRSTTYTSDDEMRQVEQDILQSLARTSTTTRRKQFFGAAAKGF